MLFFLNEVCGQFAFGKLLTEIVLGAALHQLAAPTTAVAATRSSMAGKLDCIKPTLLFTAVIAVMMCACDSTPSRDV